MTVASKMGGMSSMGRSIGSINGLTRGITAVEDGSETRDATGERWFAVLCSLGHNQGIGPVGGDTF